MLCGQSALTHVHDGVHAKGEPVMVAGIRVIQVPVSSSNRDHFSRRVVSFLKFSFVATWHALKLDYDLVFASSTPLTVAVPGLAAKDLRGKRFVFEVRDLWPELPQAMGIIKNPLILRILCAFETWTYRSADECIGLSPGIVAGIRKKKGGRNRSRDT